MSQKAGGSEGALGVARHHVGDVGHGRGFGAGDAAAGAVVAGSRTAVVLPGPLQRPERG